MKIDKIYLISVEGNFDRQTKTLARCHEAGFYPTLFPATQGFRMDPEMFKFFNVTKKFPGVGCWISHYRVFKDAFENNYENIIIFEDDVIFHEMFNILFPEALKDLPSDYEIFHLGHCCSRCNEDKWIYPAWPKCGHAYMLSKSGIEKMYKFEFGIDDGPDNVWFDRYWDRSFKINSYCLWQRHFLSQRQGPTKLGVYFCGLIYQDHELETSTHRKYEKSKYWSSSSAMTEKYHQYHMMKDLKILTKSDDPKEIQWFLDNIIDQSGKIFVVSKDLPEDLFVDSRIEKINETQIPMLEMTSTLIH